MLADFPILLGLIGAIAVTPSGTAAVIYGNSATFGPDIAHIIDKDTGVLIQNWTVSGGNGRGVVVVGDVMYTTQVSDPRIYKTSVSTGASLGFITTSIPSMSTIAWDGSTFWTSDYTGNNNAYQIDINGVTIKTIQLSLAGNNYDGMEWFNGKLIANRGDPIGPYDIYDLDGNLLQAAFITTAGNTAGIAFDGTNFFTSNIFNSSISVWDGVTGALIRNMPLTGGNFLIEDLSFDYSTRADTGGGVPGVPDGGSTAAMLGISCLLAGMFMKRRTAARRS